MTNGNDSRRRLLPPLATLQSFLAVVQSETMTEAAARIGLTQSAVSRQMQQLEEWLGVALFKRAGRGVVLTTEGARYAADVAPPLEALRRATSRLVDRQRPHMLHIATLPSFGMRWLAPRLPMLSNIHPNLIVNFSARSEAFDFAAEDFDAAIHFGKPDWQGAEHHHLFQEQLLVVCSPDFRQRYDIRRADDLLQLPLLGLESRPHGWTQWLEGQGVSATGLADMPSFEHFLMLAQAAVAGSGVALIPSFLIEPELASGALVPIFPLSRSDAGAYYLVHRIGEVDEDLQNFVRWMVDQAA